MHEKCHHIFAGFRPVSHAHRAIVCIYQCLLPKALRYRDNTVVDADSWEGALIERSSARGEFPDVHHLFPGNDYHKQSKRLSKSLERGMHCVSVTAGAGISGAQNATGLERRTT